MPALLQGQIRYKATTDDDLELRLRALTADSSQADRVVTSAILKIRIDEGRRFKMRVDQTGTQALFLDLGHLYEIQLSAHGCTKRVLLDTRGIPEEDQTGGFLLDLDIFLPQDLNAAQRRYLRKTPIGRGAYDPVQNSIEFDFGYTEQVQSHLESLAP